MVRFAWTGWWLALLAVAGSPAEAQQAVQAPPPQAADSPLVELRDNYPNPFYASTTIPFTIRPEVCREGHQPTVTLEIYNVLGRWWRCRCLPRRLPAGCSASGFPVETTRRSGTASCSTGRMRRPAFTGIT